MIDKSMIPYYGFMAEAQGILPHQMTEKFERAADRVVAKVTADGKITLDEIYNYCRDEGFYYSDLPNDKKSEFNHIVTKKLEKVKNL